MSKEVLCYLSTDGSIHSCYIAYNGDSLYRTAKKPMDRSRTGYGRKLPTQYKALCKVQTRPSVKHRLYRVYACQFSNVASFYILVGGTSVYLGL